MPEIQQPDIVGNYLTNYRQAQQYGQAQQDRQFNQQRVAKQDEIAQQDHDYEAMQRKNEMIARAAMQLNTPELWAQHVPEVMRQLGINTPPPAFGERDRIIAESMSVKEQLDRKMQEQKFGLDQRQTEAQIAQAYSGVRANDAQAAKYRADAAGGGTDESSLPPQTLAFMADQYLAGDKSVLTNLGRGSQGAKNIVALRTMIAEKAQQGGMSPNQVASIIGEFEGYKAGQRTLGNRSANAGMAVNEANQMADFVVQTSAKVPRSRFTPVNMLLQAYQKNTGSPEQVKFGAALNSFINAYARAISPTGQPTISDKDHGREMLAQAQSHEQVQAVIEQLKQEMVAAQRAPGLTKDEMRNTFRGDTGGQQPAPPAASSNGWKIEVDQ
jgi:hypothetical protein